MNDPLVFGWRSALLGLAAVQMLVLAAALITWRRRPDTMLLAALLATLAGVLGPYAIGFAGFYDRWRGLTFLPLALPLLLGPLLWGYVHTRTDGRVPSGFVLHLAPGLAQGAYLAFAFLLPLEAKWDWYVGGHRHTVAPVLDVATTTSLFVYAALVGRRAMGGGSRAAPEDRAWLLGMAVASTVAATVQGGYDLWDLLVAPVGYDAETWLYLAWATAGMFLAVEGWRRSVALPRAPKTRPRADERKTETLGAEFADRIRAAGWWRDPTVDVPTLARRLGVSESGLSRAFNRGLGIGVARFVADLRAEAVAEALRAGARDDLVALAFEAGFSSKASFNRAFLARFGRSPSAYRLEVSKSGNLSGAPETRRGAHLSKPVSRGRTKGETL